MPSHLSCPACGRAEPLQAPLLACPCGEPWDVRHDLSAAPGRAQLDARLAAAPWQSGVWRYAELIHPALPEADRLSWPEGNTALLEAPAVAAFAGLPRLALKHEGMNPTGSFKDRGMCVAVSQARAAGARLLICASTGNTAASLAAYAARAGMPAAILVPEGAVASGKLAQSLAYGAKTLVVRGNFDEAMALVRASVQALGAALLNSLNPFRLEGQKAICLELLQQRGWRVPDLIALPAGNLGNTAAFGKALREARAVGLIDRLPRLIAVQAAGAAPFAAAFARGFDRLDPVRPDTLATAIRIGAPVSYHRARRAIEETGGAVVAVSDEEIMAAKAAIDGAGIGAEPASCASVAGLRKLVAAGQIDREADAVAVLTGNLMKDPEAVLRQAAPPLIVDPSLAALRAALNR